MHIQWSYKFLEKVLIWLKNVSSIEKLQNSEVESFLNPNFDLNQTCKIVLQKTIEFGTLIQMSDFIFSWKMEKSSDLIKNVKKLNVEKLKFRETEPSRDQRFFCSDHSWTKYLEQGKKNPVKLNKNILS